MKTFSIELDYEGTRYECFVQKLGQKPDIVYIVNFKDNCLIRQFNAKKAVFCSAPAEPAHHGNHRLQTYIWNVICRKEMAGDSPVPGDETIVY